MVYLIGWAAGSFVFAFLVARAFFGFNRLIEQEKNSDEQ